MANKQKINKRFSAPIHKSATDKFDANGNLIISGYFTSDRKDQVGDIITREATVRAVPEFKQWGNIRYMHKPEPVGKVLKIGEEDGLAWNEMEIKVVDEKAIKQVQEELLSAFSVGIMVDFDKIDFLEDGGWIINEYQLAEISLVDHPANYDATIKGMDILPESKLELRLKGFAIDVANETEDKDMTKEIDGITTSATVTDEITSDTVVIDAEKDLNLVELVEEEVVVEDEVIEDEEEEVIVEEIEEEIEEEIVEEISLSIEADIDKLLKDDLQELVEEETVEEIVEELEEEVVEIVEEEMIEEEDITEDDESDVMSRLVEQVELLTKAVEALTAKTLDEAPAIEEDTEVVEEPQVVETVEETEEVEELEVEDVEEEDATPANRKSVQGQADFENLDEAVEKDVPVLDFKSGIRDYFGFDRTEK